MINESLIDHPLAGGRYEAALFRGDDPVAVSQSIELRGGAVARVSGLQGLATRCGEVLCARPDRAQRQRSGSTVGEVAVREGSCSGDEAAEGGYFEVPLVEVAAALTHD